MLLVADTSSAIEARDRRQIPLGSEHSDSLAPRDCRVIAQLARVEGVSLHEKRVGMIGHEVGRHHELERAPRCGLSLDDGPTEQVGPREHSLF